MARQYVLLDAAPGLGGLVGGEIEGVDEVIASRRLEPKVRNWDFLVLVEAEGPEALEQVVLGRLRNLSGVSSVYEVTATLDDPELREQAEKLDAAAGG